MVDQLTSEEVFLLTVVSVSGNVRHPKAECPSNQAQGTSDNNNTTIRTDLSVQVSDGPNGLRRNHFIMGIPVKCLTVRSHHELSSTSNVSLQSSTALGPTFDSELVKYAAAFSSTKRLSCVLRR